MLDVGGIVSAMMENVDSVSVATRNSGSSVSAVTMGNGGNFPAENYRRESLGIFKCCVFKTTSQRQRRHTL